jgi:hypothetical protein
LGEELSDFELSPHERLFGKEAEYSKNLKLKLYGFPEKLSHKGNHCIFLGYADDYPADIYRVLDLKAEQLMLTRNFSLVWEDFWGFFWCERAHAQVGH